MDKDLSGLLDDCGRLIITSTKIQMEEFKESTIWNDISNEMQVLKESAEIERSRIVDDAAEGNHTTANVLMHIGGINERLKVIDYILKFPDIILLGLKELADEKKDEEQLNKND